MDLVDLIVEKRDAIKATCSRYGASAVRVFGSCARADYDDRSDIDVLVRFPESLTGFDYFGVLGDLEDELKELLGVDVDLVDEANLKGRAQGANTKRGGIALKDDAEKLEKILECIDRIKEYTKDGQERLFSDHLIQDGALRNLQVIGQAVKDLSADLKHDNPDIEWHKASRMRDKLTHDYFEVNYRIVWDTIENNLPHFCEQIETIHRQIIFKVPKNRDFEVKESKLSYKLKEMEAKNRD